MNALIFIFLITYGLYALIYNFKFWLIYLSLIGIYYYLTQVKFFKTIYATVRRKLMIATWGPLKDPQIYAKIKLDITKVEDYLNEKSEESGEKITLTIYAIKLISILMNKYPQLRGYIKFGKFCLMDKVDVGCLVSIGDGEELANHTIRNADTKDLKTIVKELRESVQKLKEKKDENQNKKYLLFKSIPTFILGGLIQTASYIASIGYTIKQFGINKFEWGCCVVTSIGSLGIDDGYPPIPPCTFVPFLVSVCKKKNKFYYDEDKNIKEKVSLAFNFVVDSRFIDAKSAEAFNKDFILIGENPELFDNEMSILSGNTTRSADIKKRN